MQQQRALYVQQMLPRKIEVKLVLLDFLRSIPADKQKEVLANIEKQVEKQYYEEQVPQTMKQLELIPWLTCRPNLTSSAPALKCRRPSTANKWWFAR